MTFSLIRGRSVRLTPEAQINKELLLTKGSGGPALKAGQSFPPVFLTPYSAALKLYTGRMCSTISAVGPIWETISSMVL